MRSAKSLGVVSCVGEEHHKHTNRPHNKLCLLHAGCPWKDVHQAPAAKQHQKPCHLSAPAAADSSSHHAVTPVTDRQFLCATCLVQKGPWLMAALLGCPRRLLAGCHRKGTWMDLGKIWEHSSSALARVNQVEWVNPLRMYWII